jgi:hypothetical protein
MATIGPQADHYKEKALGQRERREKRILGLITGWQRLFIGLAGSI